MIIRATIARIRRRDLAARVQSAGLSGTVFSSLGAGEWGAERGATVEFATLNAGVAAKIHSFVVETLRAGGEQAAYVTTRSRALILWADGRSERVG